MTVFEWACVVWGAAVLWALVSIGLGITECSKTLSQLLGEAQFRNPQVHQHEAEVLGYLGSIDSNTSHLVPPKPRDEWRG